MEERWLRREVELLALRDGLLSGTYLPGPYHFFEIYEPKRRVIAAAPFRDRVVHHALCHLLAPVLERRFIARSFSCQIGKGTSKGTQAARECCRKLCLIQKILTSHRTGDEALRSADAHVREFLVHGLVLADVGVLAPRKPAPLDFERAGRL